MPYKSKKQQRKFHVDPKLKKHAHKWDQETKKAKGGFKGLPETVKKKRRKKKTKKSSTKAKSGKRKG